VCSNSTTTKKEKKDVIDVFIYLKSTKEYPFKEDDRFWVNKKSFVSI
jgi:hypothetical protein